MNKLTIEKDSNSLSNFTIKSNQNNSILISTLLDSLLFLSILYGLFKGGNHNYIGLIIGLLWIKLRTGIILEESILAMRGLGLQLTTTTGLQIPFLPHIKIPLFQKHLFLPIETISDIIINEGIFGWTIIYYLVIIVIDNSNEDSTGSGGKEVGGGDVRLRVGFEEMLPRLAELRLIWQGIRSTMFDELDVHEVEVEKSLKD